MASLVAPADAQKFPARPIVMVVPLAPGGATDTIGRIMAEGMRLSLGQPVIVENVSGAGGTVGLGRAVRSAPDGHTLLIGQWGTNVATGAIYNLPFDLLADFEPVGLIATLPFMIVGRKDLPANTLRELIAWLKEKQDQVSVGTAGVGAAGHVASVFFQDLIGGRFQFVPYRSAGLAIKDLAGGQLDMNFDTPSTSGPLVREGLIKAFAVTAKTRSPVMPEVPTVDEAGLPGFYFSFWHAIWVPKGTPTDVIATLNAAIQAALADAATQKRLADVGQEIFAPEQRTSEALRAFHKAEIEKWRPVIKAAGIKVQ